MCGILVSNNGNSKFISRRGQDGHGMIKRGMKFEHFLLNITGQPTLQPFVEDDIICVYNGEIYNHKFKRSDGENIIPLYKKHGIKFVNELDGEYAISLYDFKNDTALFITDLFATKPLWRNGIECASYESGVGGHKVKANTIEVVKISTAEAFSVNYHKWDWTQHKTSFDDCLKALEEAVLKRYKPGCFIGLSSGHDSGAIASILKGKDFKAYSVIASEDRKIIEERAKLVPTEIIEQIGEETLEDAEDFNYKIHYDSGFYGDSYKKDYAAKALSYICRLANKEGRKVYLSGAGADEIVSDYSLIPNQSEFKGKFPKELKEWKNFYDNCMYSYLGKEECVGGSWNIETRYPFLDKKFVQEFLWLTSELKNSKYKSVITEYLERAKFPFHNNKIGFSLN